MYDYFNGYWFNQCAMVWRDMSKMLMRFLQANVLRKHDVM